ncbi:hypothetical protein [Riemerella anatipestifer]|uniref:hypothetical protein n=1 Tax=Riemerella anatipestifer TaxID=34085 RepID=UPI0021A59A8A|nr:hypothetical protein [Riemerella anatipestifer]UWS40024.1 hypothetical protein N1F80_05195 [Riemerella anatipestifer]
MIRYLLFILLLCSCQKNDFDIIITNKSLSIDDTLSINFKNNSSENYLFYFESKKLRYFPKTPNSLNLVIMNNQNPIEVVYSLSDPLWLIDENGKMSIEDSTSQSKYFDCKTKYSELFIIIPAKSNFVLKRKLIDSIDDCGIKIILF